MRNVRIFAAVLLGSICTALCGEVTWFAAKSAVLPGRRVSITVSSTEGNFSPRDLQLPRLSKAQFLTNMVSSGSSYSIINGRSESRYTLSLPLQLDADLPPGNFTIPGAQLSVNGKKYPLPPLELEILSPGTAAKADEVRGIIRLTEGKNRLIYPGVPVFVTLRLVLPEVRAELTSYPVVTVTPEAERATFASSGTSRQKHPGFSSVRQLGREMEFVTAFRFPAPGNYTVKAVENVRLFRPAQENGDDVDGFFGGFFGNRYETEDVQAVFAPLTVKVTAPPAPPKGYTPLDKFTGAERILASLSALSGKVGEPLELQISLAGKHLPVSGAPELSSPDFRIYAPECVRQKDGVKITYTLIPLHSGKLLLSWRFAVLDGKSAKYLTAELPQFLEVAANNKIKEAAPAPLPASAPAAKAENPAAPHGPELLYDEGKAASTAFTWRDCLLPAAALLLAVLIKLVFLLAPKLAAKKGNSGRKVLKNALKDLQKPEFCWDDWQSIYVPELYRHLKLPPGSGSAALPEGEWRELSGEWERAAFSGGGKTPLPAETRKRLTAALKKILLWLLLPLVFAPAQLQSETLKQQADMAAVRGDYAKSLELYRRIPGYTDIPEVMYNIGEIQRFAGNLPAAEAACRRAAFLSPRHPAITAKLPRPGALPDSFLIYIRGRELLLFAVYTGAAALILLLWWRKRFCRYAAMICLCLALAAWWARHYQNIYLYPAQSAVITALPETELYSAPVPGNAPLRRLSAGTPVTLAPESPQAGFLRLVNPRGWVRSDSVKALYR